MIILLGFLPASFIREWVKFSALKSMTRILQGTQREIYSKEVHRTMEHALYYVTVYSIK